MICVFDLSIQGQQKGSREASPLRSQKHNFRHNCVRFWLDCAQIKRDFFTCKSISLLHASISLLHVNILPLTHEMQCFCPPWWLVCLFRRLTFWNIKKIESWLLLKEKKSFHLFHKWSLHSFRICATDKKIKFQDGSCCSASGLGCDSVGTLDGSFDW